MGAGASCYFFGNYSLSSIRISVETPATRTLVPLSYSEMRTYETVDNSHSVTKLRPKMKRIGSKPLKLASVKTEINAISIYRTRIVVCSVSLPDYKRPHALNDMTPKELLNPASFVRSPECYEPSPVAQGVERHKGE